MTTIAFIGLGQMGQGIAANLVRAGLDVTVHDVREESAGPLLAEGARWAATPGEAAAEADVLFTSLPTPAVVQAVAHGPSGVVESLKTGSAWFDLSTNALDVVRALHEVLGGRGVDFFDAPVSGGPGGARSGKLAIWVGGDSDAYERHLRLLERISDQPRRIGDIGAGTTAKLLHNVVSAAIHAVTAEAMSVGIKAGIEPAALFETLRSGAAGRRRSFDALMPRYLAGAFEPPSFQLQLAYKDVGLARRLSQEVGVPTHICDLIFSEMAEAMNRGWGDRDSQSFLLLQQERAGLEPVEVAPEVIDQIRERT